MTSEISIYQNKAKPTFVLFHLHKLIRIKGKHNI